MTEFDYQWKNLQSPDLEYDEKRIWELLDFTGLKKEFFKSKYCLDAGCGTGRYTWAMLRLGAQVTSVDISKKAIEIVKQKTSSNAFVENIMDMYDREYEFVLCWGVLHHLKNPFLGFQKVASQVRRGGMLHIMVYHKDTQKQYENGRKVWKGLTEEGKIALCKQMARERGGTVHGWWDALNPEYNWGFKPKEIKKWFEKEGFEDIKLVKEYNININGVKIKNENNNICSEGKRWKGLCSNNV